MPTATMEAAAMASARRRRFSIEGGSLSRNAGSSEPRSTRDSREALADRHEPTHFNNVDQVTSRFAAKIVDVSTQFNIDKRHYMP